MASFSTVSC